MNRLSIALLSVLALAGFTEAGGKYSIQFPSGWDKPVPAGADSMVQASDPGSERRIYCRANSVALPALKDSPQAEINRTYGSPLDHDTWAGFLKLDAAQFQESEATAKVASGHIVQKATVTLSESVLGREMKARFAVHILPGRVVNAMCFAPTADFERNRKRFNAALASLKPL